MAEKKEITAGTFELQGSLPRLPVLPLEETLRKVLLWTAPLLDRQGNEDTRKAAGAFLAPGGAGRKLQRRLEEWDREIPDSWLSSFWLRTYLDSPDPLVINSNVFSLLDLPPASGPSPRSVRAADVIAAALSLKKSIDGGTLPPETDRGIPLCMSQYRNMFGSTRIPGQRGDTLFSSPESRHITVFSEGKAWSLEVLSPEGERASRGSLAARLDEIAACRLQGEGIGAGTTLPRRKWCVLREEIASCCAENRRNMERIESALFVLCLDPKTPATLDGKGIHYLSGSGENRWYDKSFQIIVDEDGEAGLNFEHSGLDGSQHAKLASFILGAGVRAGDWDTPPARPLSFNLSEDLRHELKEAARALERLRGDTRLHVLEFSSFGREQIKRLGMSPDAFCQVAMQTSVFDLYGKFLNAYEAVMTRKFLLGRTEAMRPVTPEAASFVNARTAENLRAASSAHSSRIAECREGRGIDRHIFGLRKMMELFGPEIGVHEQPEFFSSPGFRVLSRNLLSTSTGPTEGFRIYGFGPVDDEGFGVRYLMFPDRLVFTMTSRTSMEPSLLSFRERLAGNLERMAAILDD